MVGNISVILASRDATFAANLRLFQHTELEHTPNRNLDQQAIFQNNGKTPPNHPF